MTLTPPMPSTLPTTASNPPLRRYVRFRTNDAGRAEHEGALAMSRHRLHAPDRHAFHSRLHAADIGSSTLVYLAYREAVRLESAEPMDYYTLQLVLSGSFEVTTDTGRAQVHAGAACVLSPTEQLHIRFAPGTRQLAAKVPARALDQAFGQLTGEPSGRPVVFDLPAPSAASWPAVLQLAAGTVDRAGTGLVAPRLGVELERMLLTALLLAQPHTATATLGRPAGGRGFRAAGEAADAVRTRVRTAPGEPFDWAELARGHGVGLRTLQQGFQHRYGRTPSQYLRDLRLERAHELLSASAGGTGRTVTDIAVECGFVHLGRFAGDYRRRYGVSPSDARRPG
ncbi:AraC family transcriptional regulator [Amycolatopsis rhabdoformis]|uniref:AraC family transcriptional regulator n=1 Tax=Amycolatopsis rhabdoformis TaxID=1448059 RepID=A0ABZ1IJW5_9PSEU|nr:AraC family transcriptional regulator [Amycolatopsis rhabdoformis]WSE34726.1 AraC family transcriptional regulator [Amycolatopsis rhabdoformis]